jgi:hypothetical protein
VTEKTKRKRKLSDGERRTTRFCVFLSERTIGEIQRLADLFRCSPATIVTMAMVRWSQTDPMLIAQSHADLIRDWAESDPAIGLVDHTNGANSVDDHPGL